MRLEGHFAGKYIPHHTKTVRVNSPTQGLNIF